MLTAWSERLWGESRAVFFRGNPLHGVKVTLRHPSRPHLSPSSSSAAQSRSLPHPAKPYSSLNPAGWGSAAQPAPTAHRQHCRGAHLISTFRCIPSSPTQQQNPSFSPVGDGGLLRAGGRCQMLAGSISGRGDACESAHCCHPWYVGIKHPPASF